MNVADRITNAIVFGAVQHESKLKYSIHIPVKDKSLDYDVPVLVEMLHPNGGKIMIPSQKINSLLALGLAIRRRYE